MKYPFRALNHNNNKEKIAMVGVSSETIPVFFRIWRLLVPLNGIFRALQKKTLKKAIEYSSLWGTPPNMLRASASAKKTASTENWFMF